MSDEKKPEGDRILPLHMCEHQVVGLQLGEVNEAGEGTAQLVKFSQVQEGQPIMGDLVEITSEEGTPYLRKKTLIKGGGRAFFGSSRKLAESYDRIDWTDGKGKKPDPTVN